MYYLKKTTICLTFLGALGNVLLGQADNITLRPITIDSPDSTIRTSILVLVNSWKTVPDRTYYWYYNEKIYCNQGGFSGKLLYGKYEVFDTDRKLIHQGTFDHGLKTSTWILWYPTGKLKETETYKNGKLEGMRTTFDKDGKTLATQQYKNGLLQGKSIYYLRDTIVTRIYSKGVDVTPVPSTTKEGKKKNIKTKHVQSIENKDTQKAGVADTSANVNQKNSHQWHPFLWLFPKKDMASQQADMKNNETPALIEDTP